MEKQRFTIYITSFYSALEHADLLNVHPNFFCKQLFFIYIYFEHCEINLPMSYLTYDRHTLIQKTSLKSFVRKAVDLKESCEKLHKWKDLAGHHKMQRRFLDWAQRILVRFLLAYCYKSVANIKLILGAIKCEKFILWIFLYVLATF